MAETVVVNTKELDKLGSDFVRAKRALIGRLGERGYQLLREEVPYLTGNLKQGVAPPDVNYEKLEATLKVTLRPRPAFNYAAAVAEGRPAIAPRQAKALLIPVPTAPTTGGYLLAGGQIYVVRRSARATQPNPYDERAAKRLENEAPAIAESVLAKFV
jgi:hypothetical protein